jgi:hypothetical protein
MSWSSHDYLLLRYVIKPVFSLSLAHNPGPSVSPLPGERTSIVMDHFTNKQAILMPDILRLDVRPEGLEAKKANKKTHLPAVLWGFKKSY